MIVSTVDDLIPSRNQDRGRAWLLGSRIGSFAMFITNNLSIYQSLKNVIGEQVQNIE